MNQTTITEKSPLTLYGTQFKSRLIMGTAQYPSPEVMCDAIRTARVEMVTIALRRQSPHKSGGKDIWDYIQKTGCRLLPNTAGCHTVDEAVTLAKMARDLFETNWIKLEVIGDDYNLQPDPFGLLRATEQLVTAGFNVLPYCTDDLVLCQRLVDLGCQVLMPWGAPIGTARGLLNPYALKSIRHRLPQIALIVDAGLGLPSHATHAMELGCDAVLLNTAIAGAVDPITMADAFASAVIAGRNAYLAGAVPPRQTAIASTPVLDTPFWHQDK